MVLGVKVSGVGACGSYVDAGVHSDPICLVSPLSSAPGATRADKGKTR